MIPSQRVGALALICSFSLNLLFLEREFVSVLLDVWLIRRDVGRGVNEEERKRVVLGRKEWRRGRRGRQSPSAGDWDNSKAN